ncbi:MAG: hypothetical protein HC859_04270, partial [Bacteroidia bacterium]|nr:hypothetical protein [Bacteroidia bacterium]
MRQLYRTMLVALIAGTFALQTYAQGTQLLRQPTISDSHIVFVYANDLWIVPGNGGDARRLT